MRETALRWLREPGPWLWAVLALGALLRVYLLGFTDGTFDVLIKLHHGTQVNRLGLLEYYRQAEVFNHPPLMGEFFAGLARLDAATGVPFRVLFRGVFASLDLVTGWLLLRACAASPWRHAIFAAYWLHPLGILLSAYHGNTDSALACLGMLSLLWTSRGHAAAAGAALGVGLWIKLPILIVAPALCLALPEWRQRARFVGAALGVGVASYLPALWLEPGLILERVVAYPGWGVETPSGVRIWGLVSVLGLANGGLARWLEAHNGLVCGAPILLLAWLSRGHSEPRQLGVTVCGSFLLLYGLTSRFAWQYLAWSIPFWFFLDARLTAVLTAVLGSYVYGAYVVFTGSPWLQGRWNFVQHAPWPAQLDLLRDASVLLCLAVGCWILGAAALRARRSAGPAS